MNIKELRIGNWVDTPYGVQQITGIKKKDGNWWVMFDNFHAGALIEKVEPIPLTEEWLRKMGFKEVNDFGYKRYVSGHQYIYYDLMSTKVSLHSPSGQFIVGEMYFIHHLQNLVFDLTQKELLC